jgi:hypothetical protein
VAVLALVLLLRALYHVACGRFGHGGLHAAGGVVLALGALCVGLVVLNTQSFARLTNERAVAEVTVAARNPAAQRYRVTVRRLDGSDLVTSCLLQGDEWEVSARVQKWKPWANILGLDSTYALDEIGNKYFTAMRGNGKMITACDLAGPAPAADRLVPQAWTAWLMSHAYVEQRRFGSAVFMPLADGAMYRVTMTQSGLNAEAVNPIAVQAVLRGI